MNRISCLVCQAPLDVRPSRGRKSGKPFIMLICPQNGRHFRGFITDQAYVAGVTKTAVGAKPSGSED